MRRRARATALVAALALLASTGWTAADAAREHGQLDVTALAIASGADRTVADDAFDAARLGGRRVDSNVVAASDATCAGCSSRATALGVVYVNHGDHVTVDNLATAASSACARCSSVAVSVQVVMLRRAGAVVANNRSLAVNAGCDSCRASAAAYQFVVVDPKGARLTGDDLTFLRAWVQTQADGLARGTGAALRSSSPSTATMETRVTIETIKAELRQRVGPGASVSAKSEVRRNGPPAARTR